MATKYVLKLSKKKTGNAVADFKETRGKQKDPEFDPEQPAFCYSRVLEIPTPRWTDFNGIQFPPNSDIPTSIVERAYTSPIWYTP